MTLNKRELLKQVRENGFSEYLNKSEEKSLVDLIALLGKLRWVRKFDWDKIEELIKEADRFIGEVGV